MKFRLAGGMIRTTVAPYVPRNLIPAEVLRGVSCCRRAGAIEDQVVSASIANRINPFFGGDGEVDRMVSSNMGIGWNCRYLVPCDCAASVAFQLSDIKRGR